MTHMERIEEQRDRMNVKRRQTTMQLRARARAAKNAGEAFALSVIADAAAKPPVLGPLGVRIVDAILELEDAHDGPCSFSQLALHSRVQTKALGMARDLLRAAGVLTWTTKPRSIRVAGRYREG